MRENQALKKSSNREEVAKNDWLFYITPSVACDYENKNFLVGYCFGAGSLEAEVDILM